MNLIAYGSLMHPAEHAALAPEWAVPVWVHGFRRAFDQTPMWRGGGNSDHTVLAVRPDPAARFNGVLLIGVAAEWTATIDHRERGYIRGLLPRQGLEPFVGNDFSPLSDSVLSACEIYVGRNEQRNELGTPLAEYHALCREASAVWGQAFAQAFEQTTALPRPRSGESKFSQPGQLPGLHSSTDEGPRGA